MRLRVAGIEVRLRVIVARIRIALSRAHELAWKGREGKQVGGDGSPAMRLAEECFVALERGFSPRRACASERF